MNPPIVRFDPKLPQLSENEKEVLKYLLEAGELIAPIYEKQENPQFPGANFYPHDVSKEEIEEAAIKDRQILSPYTIVKKEGNKLVSLPYHQVYKDLLEPVADKLRKAAEVTENKEFSRRLELQARALIEGSYEESTISWMTMKPYILDIVIGPIERYDDKLFFTKTSYQSWVGVMDKLDTQQLTNYQRMILSSRRQTVMGDQRVDYYDKVQIRIDDVLLFSGLIARTLFSGVNLPNDPNLVNKYGSEITLFRQTNKLRHEKNLIVFQQVFSHHFIEEFSPADLETGSLYSTAMHELAHAYLRYRDAENRLKDLFPIIDELGATAMGLKVCGLLLLKDIISQHQLEAIMLASVSRAFYNIFHEKENLSKSHYVQGWIILINYLIDSGAIRETGGISWPNFMKMFLSIDELASILERMLAQGTKEEATDLIKRYGDLKKLQGLKLNIVDD